LCTHVVRPDCNTPQPTATHCSQLQHIVKHCNERGCSHATHSARLVRPHCNALQHTATHCNTLQHTATHCNTLQHPAAHCITLPRAARYCTTRATRCNEGGTGPVQRTLCVAYGHTATHCNTLPPTATQQHIATHLQHTTIRRRLLSYGVATVSRIDKIIGLQSVGSFKL